MTRLCDSDEYEAALRESNVDGATLKLMDATEELRNCGVTSSAHGMAILNYVQKMKDAAAKAEVKACSDQQVAGGVALSRTSVKHNHHTESKQGD